jgi:hypothetical protein
MKEKHLKGLVHGFLTILGAVELFNCKTKTRRFVLGTAVGWHAHATFYHLVLEKDKPNVHLHSGKRNERRF